MTTDDFDLTENGSDETPPETPSESTPPDEASEPVEAADDSEAEPSEPIIEVDDDDWDDEAHPAPTSDEENQENEDAEPLGEIVDPRLATVEGGSVLDTSIPDPRIVAEASSEPPTLVVAGPTVEELQAELARVTEERDFAHSSYQSAVVKLQAAEEAGARVGVSLADEMRLRSEAETALRETQSALLTESMKASALSNDLDSARTELVRIERDLASLSKRHIFQIIPTHKKGQQGNTRVYVLADDAADAIKRVEKAGVLTGSEVENITKTSQKLVL